MSSFDKFIKIEHEGAEHLARVILDETKLTDGVRRVARQVAEWFGDPNEKPLQIISALNGAKPFTADLKRELSNLGVETDVHEVKVSNTNGTRGAAVPVLEYGTIPDKVFAHSKTLIVDDIVDTSGTINFIRKLLAGAEEVRVAVVVNKYAELSCVSDFKIHDCVFEKEKMKSRDGKPVDYWLFGYGMDISGKHRELRDICWLEVER